MTTKQSHLYAILHKPSGEFVKFGAKIAWATSGAAKNAFALHTVKWIDRWHCEHISLDSAEDYELVKIESKLFV